jgi:glycosyltransferase involved in cell wall biosynthesis
MPNAVLEAMAAGKPVVATRAEGVAELLGESAEAQCVAVGDMRSLAEHVVQISQNPQIATDLGAKNKRRAAAAFSVQAMVGQYERLYEALLTP